jgi:Alternative complex III, ActD subunit
MSAGQVYALYESPIAAQRAVNGLRAAGVAERDIMVISSEPFEEYEFSHRDKANWLFPIASGGGVLGLSLGYWLTSMTEKAWPLNTGGMPIVAMWPNLIVMFELTMLGGILATVIALFITAVLPRRRPDLYDTAVSDGYVLVGIDQPPPAPVDAIKGALAAAGGTLNKT